MITAAQITHFRYSSPDYEETQRLKQKLAHIRLGQEHCFLTPEDFDEICMWKLRSQYERGEMDRLNNTDNQIFEASAKAFANPTCHTDSQTTLRLKALTELSGVAIPVASAILALVFPNNLAVIDVRGWRQMFGPQQSGKDKETFESIKEYLRYLDKLTTLSASLDWPVQDVDLAVWEFDRREHWFLKLVTKLKNDRKYVMSHMRRKFKDYRNWADDALTTHLQEVFPKVYRLLSA